ncbi:MAG TPA: zinc-ribbon domain-containing protein [Pyrinomonadaceae bacterium]|nr:zinc-ribbon domain-containing protein [Pyrinomonadaceae bacterium]
MVLICSKCEARLQLDEAKAPSRPFTVRCPKCQTSVNVQPATAATVEAGTSDAATSDAPSGRTLFERPATAPRFTPPVEESETASVSQAGTLPGLNDLAKLLAEAMRQSDGVAAAGRGRTRPAWDRRKVLVCASPAYREVIARPLAEQDYDVFVAENMAQGLGRMREERMDIIILDANFDPLEQGVAFITREVRLLRPSERRRLFFVYLTSGVRTMDLHAAFLHNVNLVMNPSDVDQLPEALEVSLRHYNELYRDFVRALDIAPI